MDRVFQVTCWVAAFLVLAIGGRTGLMDEEAVSTLLIILPLVA